MVQEMPDMGNVTRAGYRITTRWSWDDIRRAMFCFETVDTANQFVSCVRKRRTDALALYRYLRDVRTGVGLVWELLPPSFEEEGSNPGGEGTCFTMTIPDSYFYYLWVDPSEIISDVLRNTQMEVSYPGAYRITKLPMNAQAIWWPMTPEYLTYTVCTNQPNPQFTQAIDAYVMKLKEIMGELS